MKTTERGRVLWLGGALLATLLATQWVSGGDGGANPVSAATEQKPPREIAGEMKGEAKESAAEDDTAQLELERLERRKFSAQAGDLFSRQSWVPPPPPPSKSQAPVPPPLMFKYLGKVIEGNETQVFLALAERNYVVKVGENIDNQYRVDEVTDHTVTLTYIPLNAKQVLSTGGGV